MTAGIVVIDGTEVVAHDAETILGAAERAGLGDRIPTLCYSRGSSPEGGCRLCLVDVNGAGEPVAACCSPARGGMVIRTSTPEIETLRRRVLSLMAAAHPAAADRRSRAGGRESRHFQVLLDRYGIAPGTAGSPQERGQPRAQSHPYLRFDADLCITCRRCLHVCEDLQGQFVFAVGERGGAARLLFGDDEQFAGSPCTSCGACVEACPTGAIFDIDRLRPAPATSLETVHSVCGYCGVGCGLDVTTNGERVIRVSGTQASPVNAGHLCAKGRYAHGWSRAADRLKRPLLRDRDGFREISWDDAMQWAARRMSAIRAESGPDALGVLTSSRSTNEAAYLLQRIFRTLIGTNNVDCCARVCHSSTALALTLATGTGAASASYADIEQAATIVVAGANPTEAHPVVGARIKQAARRGARLVVIDPRTIELCAWANQHLQLEPGTNVALFNALAKIMLDEDMLDHAYLAERTEGLAGLQEFLAGVALTDSATTCGIPVETLREAARLIGRSGPVLFVTGLGLSELTQGTDSVLALTNIALLTGSIGRVGAGMLPLRGQNNVQGNADMGSAPNHFTGYQAVTDPAARERASRIWGAALPATPGLTIPEMLGAARNGRLRALWVQGEDIVQSDPNERGVIAALERLDLLVVQELFMSETARYAHLVLPAAGFLEQDGTFTNGERRVQRVRRALKPPGEARADWQIARDLGLALGGRMDLESPAAIMAEIALVAPDLFGGITYARLEEQGLQWPCPTGDHPGTRTVHSQTFVRGRGRLTIVDYQPTPERRTGDYPYILITGRVLQHYNVGTMTRRTPNLALIDRDYLVINPRDAAAEGVQDGESIAVESRHGRIEVPVRVDPEVPAGTLFLSFHFPGTHANALTGPLTDPQSKCPDYKVTAVRIAAVPSGLPA